MPLAGRRWRRIGLMALIVALSLPILAPPPRVTAASRQEYQVSATCFDYWDGASWTYRRCRQTDGSDYYYVPAGNQWTYAAQCANTTAFLACLWYDSGLYVESYPDGSKYAEDIDRRYGITHTDGSVAEVGYYVADGTQRVTTVTYKKSLAMQRRSQMYWVVYGIVVNTIIQSNPTAFDWLMPGIQGSNAYMNCLHINNSSTDFDNDNYTGFNELAEYCSS